MLGQIVRLALYTGMRAGEIPTLRRGQVNLEKWVVTLTETKNGSVRTMPLSNAAVAVLRIPLANPVRPIETDLVFLGEPGRDQVRARTSFGRSGMALWLRSASIASSG